MPDRRAAGRAPVRSRGRAFLALVATAICLALTTNLAKVAAQIGAPPFAYLAWSALGAGLILFASAHLRGVRTKTNARLLEYWVLAALLSVAGPNLIFFSTVRDVGVGYVAIMIALPPLLTYAGALALGMEHFAIGRALGVLLALAGAAIIALPKLSGEPANASAALMTLLGPILLAAGNLYRTARWPAGAAPEALAPGMMLGSAVLVFAAALALSAPLAPPLTAPALGLTAVQAIVFAAQYLIFFVLQKHGGPVYLSLLGAVSAVFAAPIAILALGEAPPAGLAPAAALIGMGVCLLALRPAVKSPSPERRPH